MFQNCNKLPKDSHGTDVMRVHESHLNGLAKNLRQTVVFSSFPSAEINALTRNECRNVAGRVRWKESFSGVLGWAARAVHNAGGLRQQFERLPDSAVAVRLRFGITASYRHNTCINNPKTKHTTARFD